MAVSKAFFTPTYNNIMRYVQFDYILIFTTIFLTLFRDDVSMYSPPMESAKSQASDNETGRNPFFWKHYIIKLNQLVCKGRTFKLAMVCKFDLRSDWVPTSTSDAVVFRNVGAHLILIDSNDSGWITEKQSKNTLVSGYESRRKWSNESWPAVS